MPGHDRLIAKPLILCLECDLKRLRSLRAILERDGFNVIWATNAVDAMLTFIEAPLACVIGDHLLQGEAGVELAKELKDVKRDVPIILYSTAPPASLPNIDVYITKGGSTAGFLRVVHEVVQRFCF